MEGDDQVFRALADPTRRFLLDLLFVRDGRTLSELQSEFAAARSGDGEPEMTRFGVMKHLRVLEEANLLVTRRVGREKLHHLNPVPIRLIHDRWIDKFAAGPRCSATSRPCSRPEAACTATTATPADTPGSR